ncbi:MAG: DUF29 domain-containing protein [Acetobacteraceae bacterium]|nr:DUF29 domain-containing protein [Acetobacteraceae bacterium]
MSNTLYDQDFHAWALQQATLLREGKLQQADVENIAEEIESMGRGERRELVNRLAALLTHLLKWRFQPALRGNSWRLTIKEQRRATFRHLRDNPSLQSWLDEAMADAYGDAAIRAARETGLEVFPEICPFTFDQAIGDDFWPDD